MIALTTNKLELYRRHVRACDQSEPTYMPTTERERRKDSCTCPIVCTGYLSKHREIVNGVERLKLIRHLSLDTNEWTIADQRRLELLKRQRIEGCQQTKSTEIVTVEYAVQRYLESRSASSLNPIQKETLGKYAVHLNRRLLPFCEKNDITEINVLADPDTMRRFTESWVNLNPTRNKKAKEAVVKPLARTTRVAERALLNAFLDFCKQNKWISDNAVKPIKPKALLKKDDEEAERYGLELDEYERVLDTIEVYDEPGASELRALVELMRWTGMRISDAVKFCDAEIVSSTDGYGLNANFIQMKTRRRCECPLPDHVVKLLRNLPFKGELPGKRYWFWTGRGKLTTAINNWRFDIQKLFDEAQEDGKPFRHHVTPHCLRHMFVIQNLNVGTDISWISKWIGHKSVTVTIKHYSNWIRKTKEISEQEARSAYERQQAEIKKATATKGLKLVRKNAVNI